MNRIALALLIAMILLPACTSLETANTPPSSTSTIPTEPSATIAPTKTNTPTPDVTPTTTSINLPNQTPTVVPCIDRAVFVDPIDSEYILPYQVGESYELHQSYCTTNGSHKNQLAYDFFMPIDTPIIATRAGLVFEIVDHNPDMETANYDKNFNYVLIQHIDGTVAFYAHLKQEGILVELGDQVEQGQQIALSGASGLPTGYELTHFGVYQSFPPIEGFDMPISFSNTDGTLRPRGGLKVGQFYEALPFLP